MIDFFHAGDHLHDAIANVYGDGTPRPGIATRSCARRFAMRTAAWTRSFVRSSTS